MTDPIRNRVLFLLENLWHGHQTKMARSIGMSQSAIANVVTGRTKPGQKLLSALAGDPRVNPNWLLTGTGEPLISAAGSTTLALHVATQTFRGLPQENPAALGAMLETPTRLYRRSRYWMEMSPDNPWVANPHLRIRATDFVLMEPDQAGWPLCLSGLPCLFCMPGGNALIDYGVGAGESTKKRQCVEKVAENRARRGQRRISLGEYSVTEKSASDVEIIAVGVYRGGPLI